tara:strand:- start:206 stop:517 length:312 start_codon:yes stop_codon:yes gene_type:complete
MSFSWLLFCIIVLAGLLIVSVFFNVKFARSILKIQDDIEESLDILDQSYVNVTMILERPVFFDSVEVRQVINEINKSRDSILYVANILGQVEVADTDMNEGIT